MILSTIELELLKELDDLIKEALVQPLCDTKAQRLNELMSIEVDSFGLDHFINHYL